MCIRDSVLPASMWAMMPMFRTFSSATVRGINNCCWSEARLAPTKTSPPIVGEGLVGLGHTVDVVLLLNGAATHVGRVCHLIGQLVLHALFGARTGVRDEPADSQAHAAVLRDLDGNLV